MQGEELERALQAIARVDRRLTEEANAQAGIADLEYRTDTHLRAWAEARGLDYDAEFLDILTSQPLESPE